MTRFRFIHAADLHLDTPFEGIARVAPHVAERLRDASIEAWDGLVRLAIERQVAFVLLAGDIYDGAERGVRAQLRFCAGLQLLSDQGIQVFIVHGNHDPLDGWSAIRTWPAGVTVFDASAVQSAAVERDGERIATVHGISYPRRDMAENLALRFSRGTDAGFHVGLLHCNVGANPDHAGYCPCEVDDLMRARMDYWALGHVHRQHVIEQNGTLIVYPGTLQGRSSRSFDQGEKGAFVVEVDEEGRASLEFTALDRIRFIAFELDVTTVDDLPALQRALSERAAQFRRLHAGKGLILRPMLTGRSDVRRDLLRAAAVEDLLRVLRADADLERPFLVGQHTRPQQPQRRP